MSRGEPLGYLLCNVEGVARGNRAARQTLAECLSLVSRHRNEAAPVVGLADLVYGCDVRVIECGGGLRFLDKPIACIGIES